MTEKEQEELQNRMDKRTADIKNRRLTRSKQSRKVIQIHSYSNALFALCDDGTIWSNSAYGYNDWQKVKPIPQS